MTIRIRLIWCLVALAACGSTATTQSTAVLAITTTTTLVATPMTRESLSPCPQPDVSIAMPPQTVSEVQTVPTDYADDYTTLPGTSQTVFANELGTPAMVIIRGALPPTNWVGATERVALRGVTGAIGPLVGEMWSIAWAESADRCDLYSIYIYPPGTLEDARRVADSAG